MPDKGGEGLIVKNISEGEVFGKGVRWLGQTHDESNRKRYEKVKNYILYAREIDVIVAQNSHAK